MTPAPPYKILFLCTGNSARSILAEFLLRHLAPERFGTYSAGSQPKGEVHPLALQVLHDSHIDSTSAASKSWEVYQGVPFDFVITVCDNAKESCPIWPGQPVVGHWGMEDPAAATGTPEERLAAFQRAAREIERRLQLFINLPLDKLDRARMAEATAAIGQGTGAEAAK